MDNKMTFSIFLTLGFSFRLLLTGKWVWELKKTIDHTFLSVIVEGHRGGL